MLLRIHVYRQVVFSFSFHSFHFLFDSLSNITIPFHHHLIIYLIVFIIMKVDGIYLLVNCVLKLQISIPSHQPPTPSPISLIIISIEILLFNLISFLINSTLYWNFNIEISYCKQMNFQLSILSMAFSIYYLH